MLSIVKVILAVGSMSAVSASILSALGDVVSGVESVASTVTGDAVDTALEVSDVVESTVVSTATSQCSLLKSLVGISYTDLQSNQPDVDALTIDFITKNGTISFDIDTAATTIIESLYFNTSLGLVMFLHGFTSNPYKAGFQELSEAFRATGQYNVLALDASSLIGSYFYLHASTYVSYIGEKLGGVFYSITEEGLDPADIYVVGHSLGAHIAGFAGKQYANLTGTSLGRISGLDPAGPCFADTDAHLRLMSTDATFVDVIHTDAGLFGIDTNLGDVDYWPNGGHSQPDCYSLTCDHGRAVKYYIESVVNATYFPAVKCDSWSDFKTGDCNFTDISYMGYPSTNSSSGTYYLQTAGSSPYGLGVDGLSYS